jgi:nucleoside-diphosphate-sugar epimerase
MTVAGKTVLVTGASGFLGGALARRLADDGAQVKGFSRSAKQAEILRGQPNIEPINGDLADADSIHAAMRGCAYVFHAAVAYGKLAEQRAVNVEGTRHVAQAAHAAQVERLVHVSSIATYGMMVNGDITEDSPLMPNRAEPYNITKIEAENVVCAIGEQTGLSYSIIRPGTIYGPRSGMWTEKLYKFARRRPTPFVGDGSGHSHPIYVDDVVDLSILLATHPHADGEAFNCAPDPAPTWREWLSMYQQLAGHQSWLGVPKFLAAGVAKVIPLIVPAANELQDLPPALHFLLSDATFKMDKARDRLGWQPRVDLPTGMKHSADWLREIGLIA